jgi:hypothetical protein
MMSPMRRTIRRGADERFAAWLWTGPVGRFYGGFADFVVVLARIAWARLRRRFGRLARSR